MRAALKTKQPKPFVPSEDHESVAFVGWLELQISEGKAIKFSHLPLETPCTPIQAKRLQRMGVRRGVPDYLLVIKNRLHFIELKRTKGGVVSAPQQSWLDAFAMVGVSAHVCNGAREAKALVSILLDAA